MKNLELFKSALENNGYCEVLIDEGKERVSGRKILKISTGEVTMYTYFYNKRAFHGKDREVTQIVPALTSYLSGSGLKPLGLEDVQLRYIKNPKPSNIQDQEDYAMSLLILLEE